MHVEALLSGALEHALLPSFSQRVALIASTFLETLTNLGDKEPYRVSWKQARW